MVSVFSFVISLRNQGNLSVAPPRETGHLYKTSGACTGEAQACRNLEYCSQKDYSLLRERKHVLSSLSPAPPNKDHYSQI